MKHQDPLDLKKVELEKAVGKVKNVYFGAGVAFVPHPHIHGAWVKVHPCVVHNTCPHCEAMPGELCHSKLGKTVLHHYRRAWSPLNPAHDPKAPLAPVEHGPRIVLRPRRADTTTEFID